MNRAMPIADRLARLSMPEPNSGCWLWLGTVNGAGYGMIGTGGNRKNGGRPIGAHQASWGIANGPVPAGMHVCHHCDVKTCINPDHLYLGTPKQNMADAVKRDRIVRGEKRRNARFTDEMVRTMRRMHADGVSSNKIGAFLRVDGRHVRYVLQGKIWGHVA